MEKIKAKIGWSGDNYSCVVEDVCGLVVTIANTLEGIKKEIKAALEFHVEGLLEDEDDVPEFLVHGKYDIEFELQTSANLKQLDGIVIKSYKH